MYRSQSTSSVFIDSVHPVNPETRPSWGRDSPGVSQRSQDESFYASNGSSLDQNYEPEMRSKNSETRGATTSTLTSALTGSKMATTMQLPTSAGKRPLPKALLPKAARTTAAPSAMGGTVFRQTHQKSTKEMRRGSFSNDPTDSLIKPLTPREPHSASVSPSSTLRNSVAFGASRSEVVLTPRDSSSPFEGEKVGGVSVAGKEFQQKAPRCQSVSQEPVSWYPAVVRPIRRREPVVQDSIYPMLRAALGKDKETKDKRTEEEIVRQVFGRSSRIFSAGVSPSSSSPVPPSTPLTSPRNMYSSVDDVFASSSSSFEGVTSSKAGTLPHNHMKSNSEVITSKRFEYLPSQPWRYVPTVSKENNSDSMRQSYNTLTVGREKETMRWNQNPASDSMDNLVSSLRPPLPQNQPPPPPPPSPPQTDFDVITNTNRFLSKAISCENLNYAPVYAEPRKIIKNPKSPLGTLRQDKGPLLHSNGHCQGGLFSPFGKSFPEQNFPLLAKVDQDLLDGESEFVDAFNRSKIQNRDSVDLDLDLDLAPGLGKQTVHLGLNKDKYQTFPEKSSNSMLMSDSLPPPPLGFRDISTTCSPNRTTISSTTSTTGLPFQGLAISHQATDSINTEDSGLDRWEKEANDHSADEMDTSTDQTMTTAEEEEKCSAIKERSGNWREDQSEGRGSLASSPRPHSTDDPCFSPKEDTAYSSKRHLILTGNELTSGERNFVEDKLISSNSILSHLLTENSQQNFRKVYHRSDDFYHLDLVEPSPEEEVKGDREFNLCPGQHPSESDNQSSSSLSTEVQSSVAMSERTIEISDAFHGTDQPGGKSSTAEHRFKTAEEFSDVPNDFSVASTRNDLETIGSWSGMSRLNETEEMKSQDQEKKTGMEDGLRQGRVLVVDIIKGPVGVGFCLEGGRGSLSGDRPIYVKRLFKGGLADGLVDLCPGDEILSVGDQSLEGFSHYDAWKFIKALPNGMVQMTIRRSS